MENTEISQQIPDASAFVNGGPTAEELNGERMTAAIDEKKAKIKKLEAQIEDLKQDTKARHSARRWLQWFITIYIGIVFLLIISANITYTLFDFICIDDTVQIALLSSTVVNVVGVYNTLTNQLFKR